MKIFARLFIWFVFTLPMRLIYPTKFINKIHLPSRRCIIVANHASNSDVVPYWFNFFWPTHFMGKKEVFEKRIARWFLVAARVFPVDRDGADISAVKTSLRILKKHRLILFPEGTRVAEASDLSTAKSGVAMLALKAQVPIVPMFMVSKPRPFKRNKVFVGKPIYLDKFLNERVTKDTIEQASAYIIQAFQNLRNKCLMSMPQKQLQKYRLLDKVPINKIENYNV